MKTFEYKGYTVDYDERYWKVEKINDEEFCDGEELYTLKYVGPIVDGKVPANITMPNDYYDILCMYETFAGIKELVEPMHLRGYNKACRMYAGCCNLNPSREFFESGRGCGSFTGYLFEDTGSPHIHDISKKDGWPDPELTLKSVFGEYNDLDELVARLPIDTIVPLINGYAIIVKKIHRASEIQSLQYVTIKKEYATNLSEHVSDEIYFWVYADDFVCDSTDSRWLNQFGFNIIGEVNNDIWLGTDDVLTILGDTTIKGSIFGNGVITITGLAETQLTINALSRRQPCIGSETHDGMSYGRWCPGCDKVKKVIIDGVHVICHSKVENFAVGNYGVGDKVEIECINGGSIICPEITGDQIMLHSGAEGLCGSTKRLDSAEYRILFSNGINLGETYKLHGYDWIAIDYKDGGYVMQSMGIEYGKWPGYSIALPYSPADTYYTKNIKNHDISWCNAATLAISRIIQTVKVEDSGTLCLPTYEDVCAHRDVYTRIVTKNSTHLWTTDVSSAGKACAFMCDDIVVEYPQEKCLLIAPMFILDINKVRVVDREIIPLEQKEADNSDNTTAIKKINPFG